MVVADEAERQLEQLRLTARTDALQGFGHSYYVWLAGPESSDTQGERGRLRCASCPYRAGRRLSRLSGFRRRPQRVRVKASEGAPSGDFDRLEREGKAGGRGTAGSAIWGRY